MDSLIEQDATTQLAALSAGRVSSAELLKAALARHAETHGRLNAVVASDPERALERARALEPSTWRAWRRPPGWLSSGVG
jgi:amidase